MPNHDEREEPAAGARHWTALLDGLARFNTRLTGELESIWRDLGLALGTLRSELDRAEIPRLESASIKGFKESREALAVRLLRVPFADLERKRLYRRALTGFETYDRGIEELVRACPESLPLSGRDVLAFAGEHATGRWSKKMAQLRSRQHPLPFHAIIHEEFKRLLVLRLKLEAPLLLVLARAIKEARSHWDIVRSSLDKTAAGEPDPPEKLESSRQALIKKIDAIRGDARRALEGWERWHRQSATRLASRLLRAAAWRRSVKPFDPAQSVLVASERSAQVRRWLSAELAVELSLERVEEALLHFVRRRRSRDD